MAPGSCELCRHARTRDARLFYVRYHLDGLPRQVSDVILRSRATTPMESGRRHERVFARPGRLTVAALDEILRLRPQNDMRRGSRFLLHDRTRCHSRGSAGVRPAVRHDGRPVFDRKRTRRRRRQPLEMCSRGGPSL